MWEYKARQESFLDKAKEHAGHSGKMWEGPFPPSNTLCGDTAA